MEEIALLYTILLRWDGARIWHPNPRLAAEPLLNLSRSGNKSESLKVRRYMLGPPSPAACPTGCRRYLRSCTSRPTRVPTTRQPAPLTPHPRCPTGGLPPLWTGGAAACMHGESRQT